MPKHAIVLTKRRYPRVPRVARVAKPVVPEVPEVPVHDEALRLRTLRSRRASLAKLRTAILETNEHVRVAGHRPLEGVRRAWDWHPERRTRL